MTRQAPTPKTIRRAILKGFVGITVLLLLCGGNTEPADYCLVMAPLCLLSYLAVRAEYGNIGGLL